MKTYIVRYHKRGEKRANRSYGDSMEVKANSISEARDKCKSNYRVIDEVYLK